MSDLEQPIGLSRTAMTEDEFRALFMKPDDKPVDAGPTRVLAFTAWVNRLQYEGLTSYFESHGIRVEYQPAETEASHG